MPKRRQEDTIEYLASKLRKIEKKMKQSRRRRSLSSSSSTSSSDSTQSCSREAPPAFLALSEQDRMESSNAATAAQDECTTEPLYADTSANATVPSPTVPHGVNDVVETIPTSNAGLDPEIQEILGMDPSINLEYGPSINDELANRLNHLATSGLDKNIRKELLQKYLVPDNCKNISAPQLNPEIKAAVPEYVLKRDKSIEINQKEVTAAIACVSQILSSQIKSSDRDHELMKNLMDVSRLLCDVQYLQSNSRRNYALFSLKKDLKEQLSTTKVDKFLFGQNLTETLKAAKAVSRSSSDLKADFPRKPRQGKNLNFKAGPSRRAALGPQRPPPPNAVWPRATAPYPPPPAPPPPPPTTSSARGHSSTASSYRHRPTRRR